MEEGTTHARDSRRRRRILDIVAPGFPPRVPWRRVVAEFAPRRAEPRAIVAAMALSQRMRVGVGITVVDAAHRILVLERRQQPGAWQMPQGGVDDGEELAAAAWRELREETGLSAPQVELLRELPHWVAYELPRAAWSEKTGRGQVQKWFLFRCARAVELAATEEARAFAWWPADRVVAATAEFRRAVYGQVLAGFGLAGG